MGAAIPNDLHTAGHLTQQVFQEGDHIRRVDGTLLTVEAQLAFGRDGRQIVTGPPRPLDGCGPRAHTCARHWAKDKSRIGLETGSYAAPPGPLFDGRPGLVAPARDRRFIALTGTAGGHLGTPAGRLAYAADMRRMVADAKCDPNHDGNPTASPDSPAKAIGLGALMQESRQPGELLVG
jgi:hypothetical protein